MKERNNDKWEKLKEWIKIEYQDATRHLEEERVKRPASYSEGIWIGFMQAERMILKRMRELECIENIK
jgi:hypothetical protein